MHMEWTRTLVQTRYFELESMKWISKSNQPQTNTGIVSHFDPLSSKHVQKEGNTGTPERQYWYNVVDTRISVPSGFVKHRSYSPEPT